jgi:hypothetical protein
MLRDEIFRASTPKVDVGPSAQPRHHYDPVDRRVLHNCYISSSLEAGFASVLRLVHERKGVETRVLPKT